MTITTTTFSAPASMTAAQKYFAAKKVVDETRSSLYNSLYTLLRDNPMTVDDVCRAMELPVMNERNDGHSSEWRSIAGMLARRFSKVRFSKQIIWKKVKDSANEPDTFKSEIQWINAYYLSAERGNVWDKMLTLAKEKYNAN